MAAITDLCSFWQILSGSVRLDEKSLCTDVFKSLHRRSMVFKSGPLKDSQRLAPKPLKHRLHCMLGSLLCSELPQSQFTCSSEQVFFRNLSVFGCIHLSLSSPCLCHWQVSPSPKEGSYFIWQHKSHPGQTVTLDDPSQKLSVATWGSHRSLTMLLYNT